ncbi:MAG TPA: PhnD/SsuA/transferrin family substrate-binding protein [Steroidobacteraceae bacterium]|nr:PhnD/SsuA/transferrin family substrate-binding protein [Steroidobacteraceae bacterium]
MIANARMYSVSPEVAALWRALLSAIIAKADVEVTVIDHAAPAALDELWRRTDQGAVFMCGLPFSRAQPQPVLVAAPVPAPPEFNGRAQYWSELVVREDSDFQTVQDTFGKRIAFTVADSQSGCIAALTYFMGADGGRPLFEEVIAPTVTPVGALTAVVRGAADVAPIDSYAFALLRKHRPDLTSQVRVVGNTAPTPIPPLVASQEGLDALQSAFLEAHQNASMKAMMDQLLLERFVRPEPSSYAVLRDRFEAATRYWGSHRFAGTTHPAFAT